LNFQLLIYRPFPESHAHIDEHKFDLGVGANEFAAQKVYPVSEVRNLPSVSECEQSSKNNQRLT